MLKLEELATEKINPATRHIDTMTTLEMVAVINREDAKVAPAVGRELPAIAKAIDLITDRLKRGGRLFYAGAGTSGRLGVLDASECPPTFGTAPELVQGLIAGGKAAMFVAKEGAEDDQQLAADDLAAAGLTEKDALVALAASGRTPYSIGALKYARAKGAAAIALVCSPDSPMSREAGLTICPLPGPEVITGSTRLKAGTAQKLVLNMLSTGVMIKLGKVYGNLMVDVQATNQKLAERSRRIVMEATGCSREEAEAALSRTEGQAKLAVFLLLSGLDVQTARQKLDAADGYVARALRNCREA
ncbi:N-acetylmuramic acid 6-phosphate etherase [Anaerovibrio sp.]|uniref:N-acetylmuramic acid 6-phosphate etherase n=1 Tax=Anaerovibrio sp. TaxID=1872532 RepID=UPI003F177B9E